MRMTIDEKYPFTLMENNGMSSIDLDHEDLRILMLAVAGFDLERDERARVRELYYYMFERLCPGQLKRELKFTRTYCKNGTIVTAE